MAARRSRCVVIAGVAPQLALVWAAIASAVSQPLGIDVVQRDLDAFSSSNERMSPSRFLVNSTLPAPMNAIFGI